MIMGQWTRNRRIVAGFTAVSPIRFDPYYYRK
jgi:hypothetical protein